MLRLLAASLLAVSLALACGSNPDASADVAPELAAEASLDAATEIDGGIDAHTDAHADADAEKESVDEPCDLECAGWQHCERTNAGMACVENVCEPACPAGQRCVDGECCNCCYEDCDAGTHCEWSGDQMVCVDDPCEPACPAEQHCAQGACVANVCPVDCSTVGCGGWTYCGRDGACVYDVSLCGCTCEDQPLDPVCGLTDQEANPFVSFDNLCELTCANAVVADCSSLLVQPVCDLPAYLADPEGEHTFDNVCFAGCAGVPLETVVAGECSCAMTCTEEELGIDPVCGTDCTDYANPCDLKCAGVALLFPFACPVGCACCDCGDCADDPCPDPVCGKDGNTYDSLCILEVCHAGVGVAYAGFCVPYDACGCPDTSEPVCGTLPGAEGWGTLPNPCTAACLDATVWFEGVCGCCDPSVEAPVCAYTSLFGWTALPNQCVVDSLGYYTASYPGVCVCCGAPGSVDGCCDLNQAAPVCGADGVTYANDCALTCAAVAKEHDGACLCSAVYEPVCGQSLLEPAKSYTYPNACVAQSLYGVTATTPGACPLCSAACAGEDPEPICGLDGVTYPNWCTLLKCNGDAVTKGLDDARCYGACESCP